MDLLDNVAIELGFKFHLYLVRDELYGAKHLPMTNAQSMLHNLQSRGNGAQDAMDDTATDAGGQHMTRDSLNYVEMEPDWDQSNGITSHTPFLSCLTFRITHFRFGNPFSNFVNITVADADKKYFMSEDRIFGQKNQHVFYKLDHEGKRTQFNRDFTYMEERLVKEQRQQQEQRQKLRNGEEVSNTKWNGIIGDLISGSADMSFAALSVSK